MTKYTFGPPLAPVDTEFRCVMKTPKKRYTLHAEHWFMAFYQIGCVMDGIGAYRSASAMRRNGFKDMSLPGIDWSIRAPMRRAGV